MKKLLYILSFITLIIVFVTCQKKPQLQIHKLEITEEHVEVTSSSATITANYSYPGAVPQIKVFVSTSNSMSNAKEIDAVLDENTMTATVNGLDPDTKYYYRLRYSNGMKLVDTEIKDFTTEHAIVVPTLSTIPVASITSNSAVSGGNISDVGGSEITARGVCWSEEHNPTIEDDHTENGAGSGSYISNLTNLDSNTVYYVKAYATNGEGTGYGNEIMFVTSAALATVSTKPVTDITESSAKSGGNITNSGGMDITARGICWSTEHNPTINDPHTTDGTGLGEFESEITDLNANVVYYIRAYATSAYGTAYGEERSFTTIAGMPVVITKSVTGINASSATCGGNVVNNGGVSITARGVCWSTTHNPTTNGNHTNDGTGTGEFVSNITGLNNNTTYYVRAYATNSNGTSYGEERSFLTQEGLAVVTTNNITNITNNSAVSGGNITDDGGFSITARGVCWSTSQNPTINGSHTTNGTGTGSFSSNLTGLTYNTTYYVRAYATNSKGTSYGDEKTFTTNKVVPTVTTKEVTSVTSNSAVCGGNVTSDGGANVTARGVCYGTSQNPTISGNHTSDGNGTGQFTSTLTGLTENTTYYVRAYATNSEGTNYGEQKTFSTSHDVVAPTVTTNDVSDILTTTATGGGNVTSAGYGTVSARGVCWSTSQNPTTSNSHTTNGTGTGTFTSSITGLTPNTTYYVRAYATNEAGTVYGAQKTFTTNEDVSIPSVTTNNVSDITTTTATCGGNVTSAGNGAVSARGVCWRTSHNPTVNDSHTTDGSGTGSFTSSMTGLSPNTIYYVRAYATNNTGTAYGSEVSFTTLQSVNLPTVTTAEVTDIHNTLATGGGEVTDIGGSAVTARGICWSTSHNPTTSSSHASGGVGIGTFSVNMTGLTAHTIYYVRAYATNSAGTAYGSEVSFSTYSMDVRTDRVVVVSSTAARADCRIVADGGVPITERGVCWSTSPNPTPSDGHASWGTNTGSYSIQMTGLAANTSYYARAYAIDSYGTSYGSEINFTTLQNENGNHAYVDLGLPSGLLWATCNVGAPSPENFGDFFSWGETQPKAYYNNWSTYLHCMGTDHTLIKYCTNSNYGYNGFTDNLSTLLPEDDAATINWGGDWRIPTKEEWQELLDNTTNIWTTQNGVNGRLITSSNGNSIFLPCAGAGSSESHSGNYWANSIISVSNPSAAWDITFYEEEMHFVGNSRLFGFSVRPVCSALLK